MKKLILFVLLFAYIEGKTQCPNGDVEQGNWNNFTRMQGSYSDPLNVMQLNPAPVSTGTPLMLRQEVVSTPAGPHTVSDVTTPAITLSEEGYYCIRVNNRGANHQKDGVYYTFTVTNANKYFKFKYAMVLEDGGHPANQQPFVTMFMNVLYTGGCGPTWIPHVPSPPSSFPPCGSFYLKYLDWNLFMQTYQSKVANPSDPFFKPAGGSWMYKNWQCVQYDLSNYVGQTVSLCVLAAGCAQTAHSGYMYLDGLCKPNVATSSFTLSNTTFCSNSNIIMNGAASDGEDRYFIEIAESNSSGVLIPGGDIKSWWTLGVQVPNGINITNEYISHGGKWKCNTYYKVKLAVMSDCAPWNESNAVIKYTCPDLAQPPSQFACCPKGGGNACFNLVVPGSNPSYNYTWQSTSPPGVNFVGPNNSWCTTSSNIFNVTVTDPSTGCVGVTTTTVNIEGTLSASLSVPNANQNCGGGCQNPPVTLSYHVNACNPNQSEVFNPWMQSTISNYWVSYPFFTYQQSGGTSFSPSTAGNYAAIVSTPCQQLTLPFTATVRNLYSPSLLAPNAFSPSSAIPANQKFQIIDWGLSAPSLGVGPAYGKAVDFELRIFDRWGGNFRTIHKSDVGLGSSDCMKNGDIYWDGKDGSGNVVPNDVYVYCLSLKLCDGSWIPWSINSSGGIGCIKYCTYVDWHWPFVHQYCCTSCGYAYHVTVL